jgi:hypothetical protein
MGYSNDELFSVNRRARSAGAPAFHFCATRSRCQRNNVAGETSGSRSRNALVPISLACVAKARRSVSVNRSRRRPSLDRSTSFRTERHGAKGSGSFSCVRGCADRPSPAAKGPCGLVDRWLFPRRRALWSETTTVERPPQILKIAQYSVRVVGSDRGNRRFQFE